MKHGHVTPNEDGSRARCGGPGICIVCAGELIDWRKQHPDTPVKYWTPKPPEPTNYEHLY